MSDGIHVWERFGSRAGSQSQHQQRYIVRGTDDEQAVLEAVASFAPQVHEGMLLRNGEPTIEQIGHELWEATYEYATAEEETLGVDGPEVTFETGGQTLRITHALETVSSHKIGGDGDPIPDYKNAINLSGPKENRRVEGIDVPAGQLLLAVTIRPPRAFLTDAYVATCHALVGRMNAATFKGFARGSLLYLGGSGRASGQHAQITHQFSASPWYRGETGLGFGTIEKLGWDYLDVIYDEAPSDGVMVYKPKHARVLRLFEFGDFSLLGIGT